MLSIYLYSRVSDEGFASVKTGRPLAKKSIIVANNSGLSTFHSTSSFNLVIVIKSCPKNTLLTPSIRNNNLPDVFKDYIKDLDDF